jgi:hypothetical protein
VPACLVVVLELRLVVVVVVARGDWAAWLHWRVVWLAAAHRWVVCVVVVC